VEVTLYPSEVQPQRWAVGQLQIHCNTRKPLEGLRSLPQWCQATENTTMLQLGIFVAAMIALVVCGCIFTRKPRKRSPTEILRPVLPDEHQPGYFALEASLMTGTPLLD
jgi:hypothetical protein